MSATTTTSASQLRAIMPMSVVLPTPAPAKNPSRCPWPTVMQPSNARIPVLKGSSTGFLLSGSGGGFMIGHSISHSSSPVGRLNFFAIPSGMVSGLPTPSRTRPRIFGPTRTQSGFPRGITSLSGPIPSVSPSGMQRTRSSRKPTTSATSGSDWWWRMMSTASPTRTPGTDASTTRPVNWTTRPRTRTGDAGSSAWR
jgi:hypothetical protein